MTNITSSMDITLVTLQNCPSDFISALPKRNVFPIIYHVGPRPAKAVDILQPPAQ